MLSLKKLPREGVLEQTKYVHTQHFHTGFPHLFLNLDTRCTGLKEKGSVSFFFPFGFESTEDSVASKMEIRLGSFFSHRCWGRGPPSLERLLRCETVQTKQRRLPSTGASEAHRPRVLCEPGRAGGGARAPSTDHSRPTDVSGDTTGWAHLVEAVTPPQKPLSSSMLGSCYCTHRKSVHSRKQVWEESELKVQENRGNRLRRSLPAVSAEVRLWPRSSLSGA